MSETPPIPTVPSERQTAIYMAAHNAETLELASTTEPDEDGHIVTATVLRRSPPDPTLVPVRARVAHGVAPSTAASMLRKMADLVEQNPGFLSAEPGAAVRRLADGTSIRKRLTPEGIIALAATLEPAERDRLTRLLDQIRPAITDEPGGLGG